MRKLCLWLSTEMGEDVVLVVIYRDGSGSCVCGYLQRWVMTLCLWLSTEMGEDIVRVAVYRNG